MEPPNGQEIGQRANMFPEGHDESISRNHSVIREPANVGFSCVGSGEESEFESPPPRVISSVQVCADIRYLALRGWALYKGNN